MTARAHCFGLAHHLGLNVAPGQRAAHLPAEMSAHVDSFRQTAQSLAVVESQEKPLDDRLQLDSLSHAALGLGVLAGGSLLLQAMTSVESARMRKRFDEARIRRAA